MTDEQTSEAASKPGNASSKMKGTGASKNKGQKGKAKSGRRRGPKPYPVIPFEQALRIGQGIADFGAGHPMKRDTLLEKLGLPLNQTTKDLITASSKYGVTIGAHDSPELKLTEEGAKAVAASPSLERSNARIKLAIGGIEPFELLYKKFGGERCPPWRRCATALMT